MSKLQLTDSCGEALVTPVPQPKAAKPVGSQVMVELLSPQEIIGTTLLIDTEANVGGAPQGYILELGPMVSPEYGLEAGQRVVMSGKFTPLPEIDSDTIFQIKSNVYS